MLKFGPRVFAIVVCVSSDGKPSKRHRPHVCQRSLRKSTIRKNKSHQNTPLQRRADGQSPSLAERINETKGFTRQIEAKYMAWISNSSALHNATTPAGSREKVVHVALSSAKASMACTYVRTQQRRVRAAHIQPSIRSVKALPGRRLTPPQGLPSQRLASSAASA